MIVGMTPFYDGIVDQVLNPFSMFSFDFAFMSARLPALLSVDRSDGTVQKHRQMQNGIPYRRFHVSLCQRLDQTNADGEPARSFGKLCRRGKGHYESSFLSIHRLAKTARKGCQGPVRAQGVGSSRRVQF